MRERERQSPSRDTSDDILRQVVLGSWGITMMAPCPGQRQRHTSDGSREWNAVQAMESSLMVVATDKGPFSENELGSRARSALGWA